MLPAESSSCAPRQRDLARPHRVREGSTIMVYRAKGPPLLGKLGRYGIAFLAGCLAVSLLGAADWPQFLGPGRNGISSERGLLPTWPKNGPPVLWQRALGSGFSGPVVADGRLVLF